MNRRAFFRAAGSVAAAVAIGPERNHADRPRLTQEQRRKIICGIRASWIGPAQSVQIIPTKMEKLTTPDGREFYLVKNFRIGECRAVE